MTNPTKNIISEIKEISKNFDFVEIGIEGPLGMPKILEKNIKKIKSELKKRELFAVAHTAWYLELGSPYELVRKSYINELKKEIDLAKKIGCKKINVHSHCQGMYIKDNNTKEIIINNYTKSLKELIVYARRRKIKLMLENAGEKGEITRLEDIKKILDRVPGLYFHLDIGHAFIWDGLKGIEKYIKTFRKKLIHIHVHDNNGKEDQHKEIGKGKINYSKIVKWLKEIRYNNTITIEVFGKDRKPALRTLKKIKRILE